MPPFTHKLGNTAHKAAFLSMIAGIISLFSFFNPPTGLLFGSFALILAYCTRTMRSRLGIPAIIGIITGLIGTALSVFAFFNFILVIRIMDDPEALIRQISDPAVAQQLRDVLMQYKNLFFSIKAR